MKVELPKIYSDAYNLTLTLLQRTRSFPKHYRPILARKIEETSVNLAMNLRKMALTSQQHSVKGALVLKASSDIDDLKFLLQLCRDLKLMSAGSFGTISEAVNEIGRQIGGLKRANDK